MKRILNIIMNYKVKDCIKFQPLQDRAVPHPCAHSQLQRAAAAGERRQAPGEEEEQEQQPHRGDTSGE